MTFDTFYTVPYRGHHIHARHNRTLQREEFTTSKHGARIFLTLRGAKQALTLTRFLPKE